MSALGFLIDVFQIAHDYVAPHQEPITSGGGGSGASVIVIVAGILVSLLAVVGLMWLKRRVDD